MFYSMDSGREIDRVLEVMHGIGQDAQAPLFYAAKGGSIDLDLAHDRAASVDFYWAGRPRLMLIGDDDGHATGPEGWACAAEAAAWCRGAIVYASAGDRHIYNLAVAGTAVIDRLLLVETSPDMAARWQNTLGDKVVLMVLPTAGGAN